MSQNLTRRSLLRTALATPLLSVPALAFAQGLFGGGQPVAASQFRAVSVDVSRLLELGGGNSARALATVLEAQMRTVFADRLGGAGPLLTARITNLYFTIYSGGQDAFAFGHNDNIEGDGVVSQAGRVLSTTHILTELPPSYSGAYYTEGIDRIRLESIAHQFAYWLRREMNI